MPYVSLPKIAAKVAELVPDIEGRAFAVSDDDIGITNIPTLPFAMVAPNRTTVESSNANVNRGPVLYDNFSIEFWFKIEKHKRADQTETPFFAFYDYHGLLERLFFHLKDFGEERGTKFEFVELVLSSTEKAVLIEYRFRQCYCLTRPDNMEEIPEDITIITKICEV